MAYLMLMEYDGTDFFGFQIQKDKRTVAGELLKASLSFFNTSSLKIKGASRTDRGVHAKNQVAALYVESLKDPDLVKKGLNALLPGDVYIKKIKIVDDSVNPRHIAYKREYRYRILLEPSPLRRRYAWYYPQIKNLRSCETLNLIASSLLGERDFSGFCVGEYRNPTVRVENCEWELKGDELIFKITANRFLHKMVRIIVGTSLLVVTRGNCDLSVLPPEEIFHKLKNSRKVIAPPHGLILENTYLLEPYNF